MKSLVLSAATFASLHFSSCSPDRQEQLWTEALARAAQPYINTFIWNAGEEVSGDVTSAIINYHQLDAPAFQLTVRRQLVN